jgi:hypothetical protein
MAANRMIILKSIPMVRRLEYLETFLQGTREGLSRRELMESLGKRKQAFEIEKDLALGRGQPRRKDITQANRLTDHCVKLARSLLFVDKVGMRYRLLEAGRLYLDSGENERKKIFAEAFSKAYPHLSAVVQALALLKEGEEIVLPLQKKEEFKTEVEKYGLSMSPMCFETIRDIGARLGLMNWFATGVGLERNQHVYLTCQITAETPESFLVKIRSLEGWLYAVPFEVERNRFRDCLWETYLVLADRIPGAPLFYSSVREKVCGLLKIRDDQFDNEIMRMVEWDEMLRVIWSEGVLQYQKDSASMIKSLPPKNEWGRYVVYLKMVRR